jgi:uncharacterized protein
MASADAGTKKIVGDIIRKLHDGLPVEKARDMILGTVGRLSSAQITDIEQSLIDEGVSPDEIKRFCNVHALLFESALEQSVAAPDSPAHPVSVLRRENREIEKITAALKASAARGDSAESARLIKQLLGVGRHYALKENALFPALEKHGFPGPSKVMWSKHDEVRGLLKNAAGQAEPDAQATARIIEEVEGMIFKEESILFPAALERLEATEWVEIRKACDDIGYPFLTGESLHQTLTQAEQGAASAPPPAAGDIALPTGTLSTEELAGMLDSLPVDISFVDADDRVKYFSQSKDRIFVRAATVLGRKVQNCHPPQSVHTVEKILGDFRSGARSHADFWIRMQGRLVHIRYFAVRSPAGKYLGTLEVTQDITPLQALTGERRLLEE